VIYVKGAALTLLLIPVLVIALPFIVCAEITMTLGSIVYEKISMLHREK